MRFHNNIGPQVRRRRYALGWSQSMLATNQIAGFDISRSGVSKIEARLRFVEDKDLMFVAEVLKVPIQELFPRRESAGRLSDFMEKLETTRFVTESRPRPGFESSRLQLVDNTRSPDKFCVSIV